MPGVASVVACGSSWVMGGEGLLWGVGLEQGFCPLVCTLAPQDWDQAAP